jgi:hypothetical protein
MTTTNTTSASIQSGFVTPDGKVFATKKEAQTHLRAPLVHEAFMTLTGKNKELSDWLMAKQEEIGVALETGTIRRVSKAEHKKLGAALDAIVANGDKAFAFVIENVEAVKNSFRWPTVKRLEPEEKAAAVSEKLMVLTEGNADLVKFIVANEEAINACYEAGVEKRQMPANTLEKLAEARAKQAAAREAAKAAAEAAKG